MRTSSFGSKWILIAVLAASWPVGTARGDWDASLGLAMLTVPSYAGADEARTVFAPIGTVTYRDRFYAGSSTTDMGAAFGAVAARNEAWTWNVEYLLTERRMERWARGLAGMGDRRAGQFIATSVLYREGLLSASLVHGVADRAGTALTLGASVGGAIAPRLSAAVGMKMTVADRSHMNYDHGITAGQAAQRARLQASPSTGPYDAGGGLKQVNLGGGLFFQPAQRWSVGVTAGWSYLTGDAAGSPLTQRRGAWSAGAFIATKAYDSGSLFR